MAEPLADRLAGIIERQQDQIDKLQADNARLRAELDLLRATSQIPSVPATVPYFPVTPEPWDPYAPGRPWWGVVPPNFTIGASPDEYRVGDVPHDSCTEIVLGKPNEATFYGYNVSRGDVEFKSNH